MLRVLAIGLNDGWTLEKAKKSLRVDFDTEEERNEFFSFAKSKEFEEAFEAWKSERKKWKERLSENTVRDVKKMLKEMISALEEGEA